MRFLQAHDCVGSAGGSEPPTGSQHVANRGPSNRPVADASRPHLEGPPGSEITDHDPSLVITFARYSMSRVPPRTTIVASGQVLGSLGLCATRTSPSSDLQCPGPVSYAQSPPLPALLARRGRASVPHPHRPTRTRTVRPHPQHTMVPRGGGRPVGPRRPHRVITLTHQTEAQRAWPCPTSDQDRTMVPPGHPSARCPCAPETAGRVFCKVVGWYCSPPSK